MFSLVNCLVLASSIRILEYFFKKRICINFIQKQNYANNRAETKQRLAA